MSDESTLTDSEDSELAELVAEIGERLRRGETVRPEDYDHHAQTLRDFLPTLQMVADLPGPATPPAELGGKDTHRAASHVPVGRCCRRR